MILKNYYNDIDDKTKDNLIELLDKAYDKAFLGRSEILYILDNINEDTFKYLQSLAFKKRLEVYNKSVYIRGLIEISNFCNQDCYYCGIRKSNLKVERYRYDIETINKIIDRGYLKGYKTFVLQGGEDLFFDEKKISDIITTTKSKYDDIAITLSLGVKSKDSFQNLKAAGADRYLLRHESASTSLFEAIHPRNMKRDERLNSIRDLKQIGFQTGAGFMVGLPNQTNQDIVEDFMFLQEVQPEMIGIGPFLAANNTPFSNEKNGDINHVLVCYALARLLIPKALIPSTTATSSLSKDGRIEALKSGCNVIMINLSLEDTRVKYKLYENKTYLGDESDEYVKLIADDIAKVGLTIDFSIGNYIG